MYIICIFDLYYLSIYSEANKNQMRSKYEQWLNLRLVFTYMPN